MTTNERQCEHCNGHYLPKRKDQRYCKPECSKAGRKARDREAYQANPEKKKAQALASYRADRDGRRTAMAKRYVDNRTEVLADRKELREQFGHRMNARRRELHASDPLRNRERWSRGYALLLGVPVLNFSIDQLRQRLSMFGFKCWMCGGPFEHMDHTKPLSKGGPHSLSNIRPSCAHCNLSKHDTWPLETRRSAL